MLHLSSQLRLKLGQCLPLVYQVDYFIDQSVDWLANDSIDWLADISFNSMADESIGWLVDDCSGRLNCNSNAVVFTARLSPEKGMHLLE